MNFDLLKTKRLEPLTAPVDRVRFISTEMAYEAFSASQRVRSKENLWDAVITYSDGRNEYFGIEAKTVHECANELRRRGAL
ncbi:MAG: hypothetical protein CMI54_09060 [Parcubacteria group bacterium]|jgi:hypothetical protein|nr:hypothetical protein [Parcubacteria group bacterium]|tara:strand:+ start:2055 stop:2297 length:243 start_codon:yes stop_codon:yes gene_type:complete